METTSILAGNVLVLHARFFDYKGVEVSPTSVEIAIANLAGLEIARGAMVSSGGTYEYQFDTSNKNGYYTYRIQSSGVIKAATEGSFVVV